MFPIIDINSIIIVIYIYVKVMNFEHVALMKNVFCFLAFVKNKMYHDMQQIPEAGSSYSTNSSQAQVKIIYLTYNPEIGLAYKLCIEKMKI